jgi:hypothetical protein
MPAALLLVNDPIMHPIAARSGDLLAWYPDITIEVLRRGRGQWVVIRGLGVDNKGALAGLLADGVISPASDAHGARVRALMAIPPRPPRREAQQPPTPA